MAASHHAIPPTRLSPWSCTGCSSLACWRESGASYPPPRPQQAAELHAQQTSLRPLLLLGARLMVDRCAVFSAGDPLLHHPVAAKRIETKCIDPTIGRLTTLLRSPFSIADRARAALGDKETAFQLG